MADPMYNDLAAPSHRPMRLSNPVPVEVWAGIVSHLISERDTLRAVVQTKCAASGEAQRHYWRNDLSVCGLVEELLQQSKGQQQMLAKMVRHVTMEFEGLHHLDKSEGLQFPSLNTLSVYHDQSRLGTPPYSYARIRHLVGAPLLELEVGSETSCLQDIPPVVDNFLSALSTSINLRSLEIGAAIEGATPDDLNAALQACKPLKTLRLERYTDPLINKNVVETLARHRSIEDLCLKKRINASLAFWLRRRSQRSNHHGAGSLEQAQEREISLFVADGSLLNGLVRLVDMVLWRKSVWTLHHVGREFFSSVVFCSFRLVHGSGCFLSECEKDQSR